MFSQNITSRKFTIEEARQRIKQPAKKYNCLVELKKEDFVWEDTVILPVFLPRAVWKVVSAIGNRESIAEIISELICDRVMDMLEKAGM